VGCLFPHRTVLVLALAVPALSSASVSWLVVGAFPIVALPVPGLPRYPPRPLSPGVVNSPASPETERQARRKQKARGQYIYAARPHPGPAPRLLRGSCVVPHTPTRTQSHTTHSAAEASEQKTRRQNMRGARRPRPSPSAFSVYTHRRSSSIIIKP